MESILSKILKPEYPRQEYPRVQGDILTTSDTRIGTMCIGGCLFDDVERGLCCNDNYRMPLVLTYTAFALWIDHSCSLCHVNTTTEEAFDRL